MMCSKCWGCCVYFGQFFIVVVFYVEVFLCYVVIEKVMLFF